MDQKFAAYTNALHSLSTSLIQAKPVRVCDLPEQMPQRGVYLFSENGDHLYVGRTNRMRPRLQEHCRKSSRHNSAPFAFLLARKATGMTTASYRTAGGRAALCAHSVFGPAFNAAKARIRAMDVRFVEEINPVRQALLEIYLAVALHTLYNDFDNH